MRTLPFEIDNLNGGFMKAEGILRVENGQMVFEFQKKDDVFEVYKSDLETARIDLTKIEIVEYKKTLFGARLKLFAASASTFQHLPGNDLTERVLKIKKKHREVAASLASKVNIFLSEHKLKQLDDES
ncbi:MAG: hypothetical protein AAFW89_09495 [Bacteroidota bacterium]